MTTMKVARAAGSGGSVPVEACQICGNSQLETTLSLGYMPPVNQMVPAGKYRGSNRGSPPHCSIAENVNWCARPRRRSGDLPAGISTSSMTKILRDIFAELTRVSKMLGLTKDDLAIDIGSNDGVDPNFQKGGHRILGIEPPTFRKSRMNAASQRCSATSAKTLRAR